MLASLGELKMRSAEPANTRTGPCEEKHRLLDAFLESVRAMGAIENQQVQAVIEGDPDFSRFDLLLHYAQEAKDRAKYAWIAHVETHGCGKE